MLRKTITQLPLIDRLRTKITKLEQDKEQLRIFLHEMIEAYYRTINQTENKENFCQRCGCSEVNHE